MMRQLVMPPNRPMTSFEIQRDLKRMPTKWERAAFSQWRVKNPDALLDQEQVDREMQRIADEKAKIELARIFEAEEKAAKDERRRYLPAPMCAMEDLEEAVGDKTAQIIKSLIEAMIRERHG